MRPELSISLPESGEVPGREMPLPRDQGNRGNQAGEMSVAHHLLRPCMFSTVQHTVYSKQLFRLCSGQQDETWLALVHTHVHRLKALNTISSYTMTPQYVAIASSKANNGVLARSCLGPDA